MNSVDIVVQKYVQGREYSPEYGGPYQIVDWILVEESEDWIKGAEKIKFDEDNYRIRFVYWGFEDNEWGISRLHPIMGVGVVKEIFAKMLLKNWI